MPEFYDAGEALRLHEDASALIAEVSAGSVDDPETLTRMLVAEEEVAGDETAEERLARAVEARREFYVAVAELFAMMKKGADNLDMARIRGGHAGIRVLTLKELERGVVDH
jgi:hypothetical protein